MSRRRFRWSPWLRLAVAVALCVWLATQIDWPVLGRTLAGLDPARAAAGLAILWFGLAVAVWRWQIVLRELGSPLTPGETARVFGSGLFLNLFLPTSIGGDVYRMARVQAGGFGPGRALLSLIVERGIGLAALLLLVAPVVVLHREVRDLAPVALGLGLAAVAGLVVLRFWGGRLADWLVRRKPVLAGTLGPETRRALWRRGPAIFALSLIIHLTTVASNYAIAHALGVPLSFADALALIPLVVLAGQIPISPGGIGVREAGFVFFLGRVGVPGEAALAVGLTWLAALYLTGAVGALLFLADRRGGGRDRVAADAGSVGLDRAPERP